MFKWDHREEHKFSDIKCNTSKSHDKKRFKGVTS